MLTSQSRFLLRRCHSCLWEPFSSQNGKGLRFASLNSGISSGIRKDRSFGDRPRRPWHQGDRGRARQGGRDEDQSFRQNRFQPRDREWNPKSNLRDKDGGDNHMQRKWDEQFYKSTSLGGNGRQDPESVLIDDEGSALVRKVYLVPPRQIPYTKPESQFIYGTSAVQAAVRCGRRKLHTLYIYEENRDLPIPKTRWGDPEMKTIQKYASLAGANVKHVTGPWEKSLMIMSKGRPHNGIVLEASPLPKLPVLSFERVPSPTTSHFKVECAPQEKEEAAVNGTNGSIPFALQGGPRVSSENPSHPPRYPFVILLNQILDEGNVGAIIRSAYFFGADAVIFTAQNSAPLSAVSIKSSAGAAENMPFMIARNTQNFITTSQSNGWRFFAAEVPENLTPMNNKPTPSSSVLPLESLASKLRVSPCVLMLGSEGDGLPKNILNHTDNFVTIPGVFSGRRVEDTAKVDSLNVSVAASILLEAFLSRPPTKLDSPKPGADGRVF